MITEEKKKRQWAGKERDSSCRKYKRDHKEGKKDELEAKSKEGKTEKKSGSSFV